MTYTQMPGTSIVYTPEEYQWARNRPPAQRTPIPQVGDEVMYRHVEGGPVVRVEVLAVQDLEQIDDPNLWSFQNDPQGGPVMVEGRRVLAAAHDPWPELTLRTPYGVGVTREARLRGSCGWLPLDWETRALPDPQVLILRP